MPAERLRVQSLTEASLYLMLARCRACADSVMPLSVGRTADASNALDVPVACRSCGCEDTVRFDISHVDPGDLDGGLADWSALAESGQAPPISRTDSPSRAVDVAGWLTLHGMLSASARARMEQAGSAADRVLARQLQIQAGQCLAEALKFYDDDNDLPPESAFFTEAGRRQFRDHPQWFLRNRLVSLRAQSAINRTRTDDA